MPMASRRPASLLPTWRQTSNPVVSSPLQNMYAISGSVSAPGSPPPEDTPTRASRPTDQITRPRGESRSASVPSALNHLTQSSEARSTGLTEKKSSVKHLTCFWFHNKGHCRWTEDECAYAHHDTGRYTDPPRQVIPGEPAKAGRSLDRALHQLNMSVSSPSLSNMGASRPQTPGLEMRCPAPRPFDATSHLHADNLFLRNLVQQSSREKAVFADTIERLASDNDNLKSQVEALRIHEQKARMEAQQLMEERDALRSVVAHIQSQRISSNPFGPVGGNRLQQSRSGAQMFTLGDSTDVSPTRESFSS